MTIRVLLSVLAVLSCGLAQARAYDVDIENAYRSFSLKLPSATSVFVCHGFGCDRRTEIGLGNGDRAKLTALLAPGRASAEA
jgi:hypothetical protein